MHLLAFARVAIDRAEAAPVPSAAHPSPDAPSWKSRRREIRPGLFAASREIMAETPMARGWPASDGRPPSLNLGMHSSHHIDASDDRLPAVDPHRAIGQGLRPEAADGRGD